MITFTFSCSSAIIIAKMQTITDLPSPVAICNNFPFLLLIVNATRQLITCVSLISNSLPMVLQCKLNALFMTAIVSIVFTFFVFLLSSAHFFISPMFHFFFTSYCRFTSSNSFSRLIFAPGFKLENSCNNSSWSFFLFS